MKKRGKKAGNGIGAHQAVSPMARGTVSKTKRGRQEREARREKRRGWDGP